MCLMCAHAVIFLHDAEEGPRSLCFKLFVKTTPTREEKLISSQNGTKFARTKWGVGSSLKSNRYPGYISKGLILRGFRARSQLSNALSRLFLRPLGRILRGFVVSCKNASLNDFPKILIFRYFCNILLYFAAWSSHLLPRSDFY